ncbi:type II toxin-antitoxin system PemK/MazF family toxin [Jiella sonneratiae]|uniref:Type II toxin-antitoxin system PemK/MazF family toxin n=1 Tax=Jiella sonneratiae TaxID=2816856 RepID=A0ABS3J9U4_9HYPH|nr:type II toxin-antitoxin system PemK/MazF family toxin [Jiella sonneratiae]MBO0906453.1 type II toxin-antitoxin system PemK/MazF family toxin [Jiella sonneratiae]
MKRGDVFTVSTRGAAGKPRPAVILMADEFIRTNRPVILCPLTSDLIDAPLARVRIQPSAINGLRLVSDAMLERLGVALPREVGDRIGSLERGDLDHIDAALINILGLTQSAAIVSAIGKLT